MPKKNTDNRSDATITMQGIVEFVNSGGLERLKRCGGTDGDFRYQLALLGRLLKKEHGIFTEIRDEMITTLSDSEENGQPSISAGNTEAINKLTTMLAGVLEKEVVVPGELTLTLKEIKSESMDGLDVGDTMLMIDWFVSEEESKAGVEKLQVKDEDDDDEFTE